MIKKSSVQQLFVLLWMAYFAHASFATQEGEENTRHAASTPATVNKGLVASLAHASFREKLALVDELEQHLGSEALLVLRPLGAGELYFNKNATQRVVRGQKLSSGRYAVSAVEKSAANKPQRLSEEEFRANYKKIRVNNRLRKKIKLAISRIILVSGNETQKLAALNELLSDLDANSIGLIESLHGQQESVKVKTLMSVALAIFQLNSARDAGNLQRASVQNSLHTLKGRLEHPVKTALIAYREFLQNADQSSTQARQLLQEVDSVLLGIEEEVDFYLFIEKLFFGLSLGSVLLLAAIGLAITFGVMGVINMAHGEMIMLGAYTTYVVQQLMPNFIEYSLLVAVPAAFLVAAGFGMLIQRGVIRYLHGRPLETLLATFGVSLVLRQAVRTVFSPLNRQVDQPSWMSGAWELNPVLSLTFNRLYILVFSLLVFVALVLVIKKTWLGLKVRAVSQNRAMAKSMGIKTDWVDALTFALGSGVAGVAGVALSQLTNVGPNLGQAYIIDSFMVVVFGGVGNLLGTLVASFSLGVANKFMEPITGAVLANILVLVFIILFIQKRPRGLFPQRGRAAE